MYYSTVLLAWGALALAASQSRYVVHEQAPHRPHWKRGERVDPDAIIPLRIGLSQQNLDTGYDRLMRVADPSSADFGKHMSAQEVHDLFAPDKAAVDAVRDWLLASGIADDKIDEYENRGWLAIDLPVKDAERLFQTTYYEHQNGRNHIKLGCDEYSVPAHLSMHIDYITPGVKLSGILKKSVIEKRSSSHVRGPMHVTSNFFPPWTPPSSAWSLPPDVRDCAVNFTVACYRAIYKIPEVYKLGLKVPGNEVGLYETGDTYSQEDLNLYYSKYTPYIPQNTGPKLNSIDGGQAPVPANSPYNTGESDIDLAIITPLVYPQTVTLYQTDDRPQTDPNSQYVVSGFLNTFLDALDGSYCNYTAYGISGDSPGIDAQYPDPAPGGYKGKRMCGAYKPAKVISGSYGESELDLPKPYTQRQCNEFMKLGLQGISVFFSSGDFGVAGYPGDISPSGCLSGNGQVETIYNTDYPVNCPYITAVGATQLQPNQTIKDPESALQTSLGPGPLSRFASAGGFSNYFSQPSYQKSAVNRYFTSHDPGHPYYIANANASNIGQNGGIYNRAGRAYPDVSANGANFRAFTGGVDYHWYGTSLAAPLWAAIITLINEERAVIGKGSVGFANPVLYANPWTFTDIKNGSNANCGSCGFQAVEGWDPVTGLGVPNFPLLSTLYLALP